MKIDIEKFAKRFPRLAKFLWGEHCPKCENLMNIYRVGYAQCPNCGYKKYNDMVIDDEKKTEERD